MENNENTYYVRELRDALMRRDAYTLRELSNQCSDSAFITQDKNTINLGIITYAFHKIFLKRHYRNKTGDLLEKTRRKLNTGNYEGIIEDLKQFDRTHGFFQGNIVKKARIKMGARLYTKGLSLSKAAELVSVNISDILKYAGGTQVHEKTDGKPLKERLETARKILKE